MTLRELHTLLEYYEKQWSTDWFDRALKIAKEAKKMPAPLPPVVLIYAHYLKETQFSDLSKALERIDNKWQEKFYFLESDIMKQEAFNRRLLELFKYFEATNHGLPLPNKYLDYIEDVDNIFRPFLRYLDDDKMFNILRAIKKRDSMQQVLMFEFDWMANEIKTHQYKVLETLYLKIRLSDIKNNINPELGKINKNPFPNIFTPGIAFSIFEYLILNSNVYFRGDASPAQYSRIFQLLRDEDYILNSATQKDYREMITDHFNKSFRQFDNRSSYSSLEKNILKDIMLKLNS